MYTSTHIYTNICGQMIHLHVLQHTATHCNTLQHTATHSIYFNVYKHMWTDDTRTCICVYRRKHRCSRHAYTAYYSAKIVCVLRVLRCVLQRDSVVYFAVCFGVHIAVQFRAYISVWCSVYIAVQCRVKITICCSVLQHIAKTQVLYRCP